MLLLTVSVVAVSGTTVSVSAWAEWTMSAQAGKAGHSDHLVMILDENAGASRRKTTTGGGLKEDRGGLLGLLNFLAHVGREPWCSRGPRRDPAATIC